MINHVFIAIMLLVPMSSPPFYDYGYYPDYGDWGPNYSWTNNADGSRDWEITHALSVSKSNAEKWTVTRIKATGYHIKLKSVTTQRTEKNRWLTKVSTSPF